MAPQLYITAYKEQFSSPGRVKRTELRPTSAHRRNNPHPGPDFLFPRSLQPFYRPTRAPSHPVTPADTQRPFFPPVKHLSFRSPVANLLDNSKLTTNAGQTQHMPPINSLRLQTLPSSGRLQKLQPAEPTAQLQSDLRNLQRKLDYQRGSHPLSAPQLEQKRSTQLLTRPQTSNPAAASHHDPLTQYRKCRSNSSLDNSGCYSCFHVVKPYQAGHYIIHPEFVSESLY